MPTIKPKTSPISQKAHSEKKKSSAKPQKSGQEKWDELLQTPESEAFLTMLVAEVRAERKSGKLLDGDWE